MEEITLFEKNSISCSKLITQNYNSNFKLGIHLLNKKYHAAIYTIYGFVRFANGTVKTFLDHDRSEFLERFKKDTFEAIEGGLSFNPVMHAFQITVNKHKIEKDLIEAFFKSMEMDLNIKVYDNAEYQEYIYCSAEVVGLMCLRVFCDGDDTLYHQLEQPARKLASAFQKVNLLSDIKSEFEERGRIYFPGFNYKNFDVSTKMAIEKDIQEDFDQATPGIKLLPEGAQTGVQIACMYFKRLFQKIISQPPQIITQERIRLSTFQKILILVTEKCLYFLLNILIISVPLACSFESRVNYYAKWSALFPAIFMSAAFFIPWDILFTHWGVWMFNPRYLIGVNVLGLPIEEWMFFFTVPYSCVFIYECMNYIVSVDICQPIAMPFFYLLTIILLAIALMTRDKLNICTNALLAVGMILAHVYVFGDRLIGRFMFALIIHYIPFFICNSVLTGSAGTEEPVVRYNDTTNTRLRIRTIPVEDAIYSLSLLLMNVSLFEWFQM